MVENERGAYPSSSALHRIVECRGSWRAEQGIPESQFGAEWRDEGTMLHDIVESGKLRPGLTDEQQWCVKTAWKLRDQFLEDYGIDGVRLTEQRYWAHKPDLTPLYSGKFDEVRINDTYAGLIDYKFGRTPVTPAAENIQMLSYATLLYLNHGHRDVYAVAIIQPRCEEEQRITVGAYLPEQLQEAYEHFCEVITDAQQPNQPRTPSYHACEYCRALHVCPQAWQFFTHVNI